MIIVESILSVDDNTCKFRASCGHILSTPGVVRVGSSINCILCSVEQGNRLCRERLQFPANAEVLDALTADYVATMQPVIGREFMDGERAAVRRAASIQLAWYAALRRVVG